MKFISEDKIEDKTPKKKHKLIMKKKKHFIHATRICLEFTLVYFSFREKANKKRGRFKSEIINYCVWMGHCDYVKKPKFAVKNFERKTFNMIKRKFKNIPKMEADLIEVYDL